MTNKYTGETKVDIGGKSYTLVLDWRAIAAIKSELGEDGSRRLLDKNPEQIAAILEIGFRKHHPDVTKEIIMDASPPIVPVVNAIDRALEYTYFGPNGAPTEDAERDDESEKKTT